MHLQSCNLSNETINFIILELRLFFLWDNFDCRHGWAKTQKHAQLFGRSAQRANRVEKQRNIKKQNLKQLKVINVNN